MKWPCSGYWQSYCLWSERSWLVSPVKQHDAGNLRTSLGRWPPGWICIPWDHGIILNLCLSDSLENLRCHFKVAGTEFSSLWRFFLFLPRTLFILGWRERLVFCLLGNMELLMNTPSFFGQRSCQPIVKMFSPFCFPRAITTVSDVTFVCEP